MTPHFCPACDRQFQVPEHYLGKIVTCPGCQHKFTPSEATLSPKTHVEESAPDTVNLHKEHSNEPPAVSLPSGLVNWWSSLTQSIKAGIVTCTVIALTLIVGIPVYNSKQKAAQFESKYDEFIFEADQLANLTNYGVNKGDFTRQFARVEAKWDAIPSGGFKDGAWSDFYDSMARWREVVRYWDSDYLRDQVPLKMSQATTKYKDGKNAMK